MTSGADDKPRENANALIVAIAETGDQAAFARLFELFAPLIKAHLKRAGCPDGEAEELAQETMLAVWRKAGQFDAERASAAAWIYTIARNLRIDGLRRRHPTRLPPEADIDDAPSPLEALVSADAVERLKIALTKLPPDQIVLVRAAFEEHHAHAAIAEKFDLPLGTVKSRLRRALQRLRSELEPSP